jgi:hypothetical protein
LLRDRSTTSSRAHMRMHHMSFTSRISAEMVLDIVWHKIKVVEPIGDVGLISLPEYCPPNEYITLNTY